MPVLRKSIVAISIAVLFSSAIFALAGCKETKASLLTVPKNAVHKTKPAQRMRTPLPVIPMNN